MTAKGHDGRIRCFLGFVWRYECLRDSKELCLGLLLNCELVESYVGFLEKVRRNKSMLMATGKMVLSQYKTAKKLGVDVTELDQFEWLTKLLEEYLSSYRALLVGGLKHRFVFCTRFGTPFSQSHFSEFLSNLIKRHTGQKVGINLIRASAVTQFYDSEKADSQQACESFAKVMRRSVPMAMAIYDRRSPAQKKRIGLEVLAEFAAGGK